MRLLKLDKNGTFDLVTFHDGGLPPYAILSHTWSTDDHEEVTFDDIADDTGSYKAGFAKLQFCAQQIKADKLEYFWIDTCCIKKSDSAELSKSITSMYRWYSNAVKCYVYLSDVSSVSSGRIRDDDSVARWHQSFRQSQWFTRGWTLQELLAPPIVEFFSCEGRLLCERSSYAQDISMITTLPIEVLTGSPVQAFSVDDRMQWGAERATKESEDRAYCMLGIFGVYLVPNYGEGIHSAVRRLEQEIAHKYQHDLHGVGNILIGRTFANEAGLKAKELSKRAHRLQERQRIFENLKDANLDARRLGLREAQAGTCAWFLHHPVFITWISKAHMEDHHGFLWLRGNPGTGKSTLMKFVYDFFEQQSDEGGILISFFFNARGDTNEKTTRGMWRALLYQLLNSAPDLRDTLDEFGSNEITPNIAKPLSVENLYRAFQRSILRLGLRRLRCFVDALDECDEQQIQDMVEAMEIIAIRAFHAGVEFRVCFASRHYPNIIHEHGQQIVLEAEPGHQIDLEVYAYSQLRRFRSISIKGVGILQSQVLARANGVFIWAVLVISMLKREFTAGRILDIEAKVAQFPRQLDELFREVLCRDERDLYETRLAIQCILFAKRPLSMSEYYYAINSGCTQSIHRSLEHDPQLVTEQAMRLFVSDSTKGLAEVTRSYPPTVQFIHESVRDFLLGEQGLSQIWPDLTSDLTALSHERLKLCCYAYLHASSRVLPNGYPKVDLHRRDQTKLEVKGKLPFLEYAVEYVLYHAEESAKYLCQTDFLRELDIKYWSEAINFHRSPWPDFYTPAANLLYILAYENCPRLIRMLCPAGPLIGEEGEHHRYPLYAARVRHNLEAMHALLQFEAPLDFSMVPWSNLIYQSPGLYEPTPLLWAIKRCGEAIAHAIVKSVDRSSILRAPDRDGLDPLDHAVIRGYARVVQELIGAGIALRRTVGASSESPLCYSSRRGHYDLVRFLLEQSLSDDVREATRAAAEWGSLPTLKLLLPRYADAHTATQPVDYSYILEGAAKNRHDVVIDFLMEQEVQDRQKAHIRHVALVEAARRGQDARLLSLLSRGVFDEACKEGVAAALLAAARNGHHFTSELLLQHGADPAASDVRGMTALHHAAEHGRLLVIQKLLSYGADPDARDRQGRNSLLSAAMSHPNTPELKAEKCVIALLESGADTDARDSEGNSLLSYTIGRAAFEEWDGLPLRVRSI